MALERVERLGGGGGREKGVEGGGGKGVAEANKNNPLQLDQTASVQKPVVPSLERAAAVIFFFSFLLEHPPPPSSAPPSQKWKVFCEKVR